MGLVCLCFCVGMFKVVRVSPDEILPVVRISGLDYAQAWLAKRQAMRHEREGGLPWHCWRGNPASRTIPTMSRT